MNCILRGVRVIDPAARLDSVGQDVWLSDGRIIAIYKHIGEGTLPVIDLTPRKGEQPCVLSPGFIDLHTHLRQAPHADDEHLAENIRSGSMAAAAGGFTQIVAMANTDPTIDTAEILRDAKAFSADAHVRVLHASAVTQQLRGEKLVDIAACAEAGAIAFSDDGRNAASTKILSNALRAAAHAGRPILVHAEDEETIAEHNEGAESVALAPNRPVDAEAKAVSAAITALQRAGRGHLHFQHVSTERAVQQIANAKASGMHITAEATPHHLGMWLPLAEHCQPESLTKVNPPLRTYADRNAVVQALREGIIDAVATDHAPHLEASKNCEYEDALPGMVGLETALAACLTLGAMGGDWLPTLIARLTVGPYNVLEQSAELREPRLRIGEAATCVLFDPAREWVVGETPLYTGGKNTPLWGKQLRGKVLMTLVDGVAVYHDTARLPWTKETANV